MKVKKKRCAGCRKWFRPNPRTIRNNGQSCQNYCSKVVCRNARKKEAQLKWLAKNPNYFKGVVHKRDCQSWAREHPDYWKNYRARRPAYVEINRQKQRTCVEWGHPLSLFAASFFLLIFKALTNCFLF